MSTYMSGKIFLVVCLVFCLSASTQAQSAAPANDGISSGAVTANTFAGPAGGDDVKGTVLTKKETRKMTRVLCKCFTARKHSYPLQRYNRQYVAYINGNGEKEVLINCYYKKTGTNLGEARLPGADGKQSYFRATINLHTMRAQDFGFHESAVPARQDMSLK
jgi:hypothetical protein